MIISIPTDDDWTGGLQVIECAFHLEKEVNQSLLDLHELVTEKGNTHLCDFLKHNFLYLLMEMVNESSNYMTQLCRMGTSKNHMDEYLVGKHSLVYSTKEY